MYVIDVAAGKSIVYDIVSKDDGGYHKKRNARSIVRLSAKISIALKTEIPLQMLFSI